MGSALVYMFEFTVPTIFNLTNPAKYHIILYQAYRGFWKTTLKIAFNVIQMAFPAAKNVPPQVLPPSPPQVSPQVERLLEVFKGTHNRQEFRLSGLSDRKNLWNPAIEPGLVAVNLPTYFLFPLYIPPS